MSTDIEQNIAAYLFAKFNEFYDAFRELKDDMTLVHASSAQGWERIPRVVRKALNSKEAGQYIPVTVVVNSSVTRVIAVIPYVRDPGERVSRLEKAIEDARGGDGDDRP